MPRKKLLHKHYDMLAAEAAAALEDLPAVKPGSGRFYLWLMEAIAWDNLGWSRAQEAARACLLDILAALREGYLPEDLVTLAGIGSTGHQAKNAKRDAEIRLLEDLKMPEPYPFKVDCIDPRSDKEALVECHTASLLLQDYMSYYEEHWEDHFRTTFGTNDLRDFWEACDPEDPKFYNHPMLEVPNWQDLFIPYFMHGDFAEFADRDSLMTVSASGVLAEGETRNCKLWLWSYAKSCQASSKDKSIKYKKEGGFDTGEQHWKMQVWDCKSVFEGKWAKEDHLGGELTGRRKNLAGQAICKGKYRMVCWGLLGDTDFFANDLNCKHWGALQKKDGLGEICEACPANNSTFPWNHWSESALCKLFCYKPEEWAAVLVSDHPIWELVTRFFIHYDGLHILEQNGCTAHAVASALVDILQKMPGREALEKKWSKLWSEAAKYQDELWKAGKVKYPLTRLDLNWVKPDSKDYPCITTAVKAAQLRDLVPVVLELCERYNSGSTEDRLRLLAIKNLQRYYEVVAGGGMFLTEDEKGKLLQAVQDFQDAYGELCAIAQKERKMLWSETPKLHFFWHLAKQGQFLNPKIFWTYMSEDFVGKVSKLGHSLLKGTKVWNVPRKLAEKYRFAMHFWLKRHWMKES